MGGVLLIYRRIHEVADILFRELVGHLQADVHHESLEQFLGREVHEIVLALVKSQHVTIGYRADRDLW